jgi:hypothetical protein
MLEKVRFVNELAGSPPNSFEFAALRGYLRKDVSQRTDTLDQTMLAGETVVRTAVRDRGPHRLHRPSFEVSELPDALNAREKGKLRLMAGLSNYRYSKLFRKDVVIKKAGVARGGAAFVEPFKKR